MKQFIYCYAECHYAECHYAECHYADCHYAECHYAECHYAECLYAKCRYAKCRYAKCRYAKCRYAKCRYAECRYAKCRSAECRGPHPQRLCAISIRAIVSNKKKFFVVNFFVLFQIEFFFVLSGRFDQLVSNNGRRQPRSLFAGEKMAP